MKCEFGALGERGNRFGLRGGCEKKKKAFFI